MVALRSCALLGALCLAGAAALPELGRARSLDADSAPETSPLAWSTYLTGVENTPVTWIGVSPDGTIFVKANGQTLNFQLPTPSPTLSGTATSSETPSQSAAVTPTRSNTPSRTRTASRTHVRAADDVIPIGGLDRGFSAARQDPIRAPHGKAGLKCGHGGVCRDPTSSPSKHKKPMDLCGHGGTCYDKRTK